MLATQSINRHLDRAERAVRSPEEVRGRAWESLRCKALRLVGGFLLAPLGRSESENPSRLHRDSTLTSTQHSPLQALSIQYFVQFPIRRVCTDHKLTIRGWATIMADEKGRRCAAPW